MNAPVDERYHRSSTSPEHPAWSKDAVLYQINTRQFTPEGTFRAAERELPRLKTLGVDILWLMPVHPIGAKNRKGTLGSPYSVRDYYGVNPEFGTLDDLKHFVDAAHAQGMYVILDWVANHTAWDNPLVAQHPEWYQRDWKGDSADAWGTERTSQYDFDQPAGKEAEALATGGERQRRLSLRRRGFVPWISGTTCARRGAIGRRLLEAFYAGRVGVRDLQPKPR